jgi:hypothetical protein
LVLLEASTVEEESKETNFIVLCSLEACGCTACSHPLASLRIQKGSFAWVILDNSHFIYNKPGHSLHHTHSAHQSEFFYSHLISETPHLVK